MTEAGSYDAFRFNQFECSRVATAKVTEHRFGLVNFDFEGTVSATVERSSGTHYTRGLPVTLSIGVDLSSAPSRALHCPPETSYDVTAQPLFSDGLVLPGFANRSALPRWVLKPTTSGVLNVHPMLDIGGG
jgi:hypothetical protein